MYKSVCAAFKRAALSLIRRSYPHFILRGHEHRPEQNSLSFDPPPHTHTIPDALTHTEMRLASAVYMQESESGLNNVSLIEFKLDVK